MTQPLWFLSSTNHHYKLELFLELAGICIHSCWTFILQNPTFHLLPAAFCLIEILMELPPLMDFFCYSVFLLYRPLFLSRLKLLKVQHCTHLPFGNDSDLLRKKKTKQF